MEDKSYNEIPDLSEDWGLDTRNGLPYSGKSVQDFIKSEIRKVLQGLDNKFGSVSFEGNRLVFYDEEGGLQVGSVAFSGTSYIVSVETNAPTAFTVLSSEESRYIKLTPSTKAYDMGGSESVDYPEDYIIKLEVDAGKGFVDKTPLNSVIRFGESLDVDIRQNLTTGLNRVRIVVTGLQSNQVRTLMFTVTLTSLYLTVEHPWNQTWIGGEDYMIRGIFFSGNIAKTLHVKVDGVEYTQAFSASNQYVNVPYSYDITAKMPSHSGIVPIEMWMSGEGVQTDVISFNLSYVAAEDVNKISLICINNVPSKVYNFSQERVLSYSVYNISELDINVRANFEENEIILMDVHRQVQSQTIYDLDIALQIDTDLSSGITLTTNLSSQISEDELVEKTIVLDVDNSNAFLAVEGAKFYLNPSLRSNSAADRYEWFNTAPESDQATYMANWEGFTFSDDAWSSDPDGNRALCVKAGSYVEVPELKPLIHSGSESMTLEFMYRASNIADYDTPILSIMDTEEFDSKASTGVILFPTKILVMTNNERSEVFQQLPLSEDRIIHITVVLHRQYANNAGRNLVRIFINGCENVTFSINAASTLYNAEGLNYLRIGQESTDTYLYMMRCYDRVLEGTDIVKNYLNALIDTEEISRAGVQKDNNLLDGGEVNYELAKKAGFNCFVIETDNVLPSLENPETESLRADLHFEYNDYPEWNVSILGAPLTGQGTTSLKYSKWNFRSIITDNSTTWRYNNMPDPFTGLPREEKGVDGYIAGYNLNPRVSRITAKKNIASQPQGHKMGATAFYHELFIETMGGYEKLVVDEVLPNAQSRVALYQYPFLGFQKYSDGRYEYRGLYTIGPDKGDKKTFGYNETEKYPNLMMVEGPNHDPYLTRFLIPWTSDVFYDYANETLSVGEDGGIKEEGWDAGAVSSFDPSSYEDASKIMELYRKEFKPAYDAVYYNSPYIAALSESGYTLEEINANVSAFQKAKTGGHVNKLMTFYNENYELIYYRVKTGQYEVLSKEIHDMLSYLGLSGTPSTQDILNARAAQWTAKISEVVNINEAYYHQCFCELLGISDNEAKNTYWRKFKSIENGGKWGFQQDDLDTIFQNDNNGQDTKDYFVEPDDQNENGGDIFQGRTSAFWYALRQHSKNELRVMMRSLVNKALVLAGKYKISAGTVHQSLFNLIGYYFWSKSSKYFPATAYNEDTKWAYINIWYPAPDSTYNGVPPLTQIHGDHYETEREWVEKRIAYIFSKYQIGAFEAQSADGYGSLEFTAANDFTMNVTPAIALYPRTSKGGAVTEPSERTMAGEVCPMTMTGSGDTARYLKGLDWLSDLGDCSELTLASRGGATEIAFTVDAKRLRRLKVGDEDPEKVKFNATRLAVSGEAIEEIDARNVPSIEGSINLGNCPRLRRADFTGTNLAVVLPPVGGRMRYLALPKSLSTLFLHNLNLLEAENLVLEDGKNINLLYFNTCSNLEPLTLLRRLVETPENKLQGISMIFTEPITDTDPKNMEMLADFVRNIGPDGYFLVSYSDGTLIPDTNKAPDISGKIITDYPIYEDSVQLIEEKLVNLDVVYNPEKVCIRFADDEVKRILSTKYGYVDEETGEPFGMTQAQADKVTSLGTIFRANTNITSFDEFERFTNVKTLYQGGSSGSSAFYGCTGLTSIKFPPNLIEAGYMTFDGCINLRGDVSIPKLKNLNYRSFANSGIDTVSNLGEITRVYEQSFIACKNLKSVILPNTINRIDGSAFSGCTSLSEISGLDKIVTLGGGALKQTAIKTINMPLLEGALNGAEFQGSQIEEILSLGKITDVALSGQASYGSTFGECKKLKRVFLPETLHTIGKYAFQSCTELEYVNLEEIGNSIIKLDYACFDNCPKLSFNTLSFPNLTLLAEGVFRAKKLNQVLNLGTIGNIPNNGFRDCTTLSKIVLPETLYQVGDAAFYGDTSLTDINLSGNSSIQIISSSAFAGCTSLEIDDLSLPSLTSIGWASLDGVKVSKISNLGSITTFPRCLRVNNAQNTIKEIVIPDTCTILQAESCGGITSLEKVTLPEGLKEINQFSFDGCSNLTEINLPSSLEVVGGYTFRGCSKMAVSVYLPNLRNIEGYGGTYMFQRSGITEILSLGHISAIPYAFMSSCSNLTKLILSDKIQSIDNYAMENCTRLETMVLYATLPPVFNTAGFNSTPIAKGAGYIYVPDDYVEDYKNAMNWINYASQILPISDYDGELPDLPEYFPERIQAISIVSGDSYEYPTGTIKLSHTATHYYGEVAWSITDNSGLEGVTIDVEGYLHVPEVSVVTEITVRCQAVDIEELYDEKTLRFKTVEGVTAVEYIQTSGSQGLTIPYYYNPKTEIDFSCRFITNERTNVKLDSNLGTFFRVAAEGDFLFACNHGGETNNVQNLFLYTKFNYAVGGTPPQCKIDFDKDLVLSYKYNSRNDYTFRVNGYEKCTLVTPVHTFTTSQFDLCYSSAYPEKPYYNRTNLRIYGLNFSEEGVYQCILLPAKSNGRTGLYDLVSGEFIGSNNDNFLVPAEYEYKIDVTPNLAENRYYHTNVSVGSTWPGKSTTPSELYKSTIYTLPEDANTMLITGSGGMTPRLYCFLGTDDVVLSVAPESLTYSNETRVEIPEGALKVVLNINKTVTPNKVIIAKEINKIETAEE